MFTVNSSLVNVIVVLARKIIGCYGPQGPLETIKVVFFRVFLRFLLIIMGFLLCNVNSIFDNVIEVLASKIFGCYGPQGPLEIIKANF